jgi:ABC-type sulfate/molybdate transport systems ATPase subunit
VLGEFSNFVTPCQLRYFIPVLHIAVRDRTGVTTLHITHDQHDAERLADRLFVLKNGAIEPLDDGARRVVEYAKKDN